MKNQEHDRDDDSMFWINKISIKRLSTKVGV